ncbi:hypothetical protein ABIB25_003873 [Nakamurella sp. UYEF19]|uniref:hypothetical protein n=1 Tax=Nakamurella sp. UYEF19 TaxID=1756392 RepID=UPI0033946AB5
MINPLESEFAARADTAPDVDGMLQAIHARVAKRQIRRRRLAVTGVVGAVALVSAGAVLLTSTPRPQVLGVGSAVGVTSAAVSKPVSTYLPGDPGVACDSQGFEPAPAPLAQVPASPGNIALTSLPQGWSRTGGGISEALYSDPADPNAGSDRPAGQLLVLVSSLPDQEASYDTTIAGRLAVLHLIDPCTAAGYPGTWLVSVQYAPGIAVQVQGPISLGLSETQIRQIVESVVVRKLVPGLG